MTTHTPPADDPRIAALAAGVERVSRRVGALGDQLSRLADDVARLATANPPSPVPDWLFDPAAVDVAGLLGWLDQIYLAFDGSDLPPCWAFHRGVTAELAWLWLAHQDAYASGDVRRVGDWFDRYRPGVVRRVVAATARCGDLLAHTPGGDGDREGVAVPLSGALTDIQAALVAGQPQPAPTEQQLTQARTRSSRTGQR